jgi:hypothetical protein
MRVKRLLELLKDIREDYIVTDYMGFIVDDVEVDDENKALVFYTEED